jgi:hypothetical protein
VLVDEDDVIVETHDKILDIFNKVKKELGTYLEYDDFKKSFSDLIRHSFPRLEEDRWIEAQPEFCADQKFHVNFIINTIPVKITNDIHGIGHGIMRGILSSLSCRVGIIINVVDVAEPEFIVIS